MHSSQVILISFFTSVLTAGSTVYLTQRLGVFEEKTAAKTHVPGLQGLSEDDARTNLQAAKLTMMIGPRKESSQAAPGTVLEQIPPPGQQVDPGSPVTVTLAVEAPKVPDVANMTVEQATAMLEQVGLKVEVGEPVPNAKIPPGSVVSQAPRAGANLEKDGKVVLQASAGPAPVAVPKVTGLNVASAKKTFTEAGLELGAVRWVHDPELWPDAIVRQKPAEGEKVAPGTAVEVTVNRE